MSSARTVDRNPLHPQRRLRELFQRAVAHIRATHLFDAMNCLDELLEMDPGHADALACRGWIHALRRQSDLARADLEAALRHAPAGWPRAAEVRAQLAIEAAAATEVAALPVQLIA
jgi:regulator of sirC expression with transglutaminase-like and TPR domain